MNDFVEMDVPRELNVLTEKLMPPDHPILTTLKIVTAHINMVLVIDSDGETPRIMSVMEFGMLDPDTIGLWAQIGSSHVNT